jgi:hypothetical protein
VIQNDYDTRADMKARSKQLLTLIEEKKAVLADYPLS